MKTMTTRQVLTRALRTVRAAATMEAAGVGMTYRPGSIVVTGNTYPLRATLKAYGFRFGRQGRTSEWRWTGRCADMPAAADLYGDICRALAEQARRCAATVAALTTCAA